MVGVEIDGWDRCCGCVVSERCDRGYIDDMTVVLGFIGINLYLLSLMRCAVCRDGVRGEERKGAEKGKEWGK